MQLYFVHIPQICTGKDPIFSLTYLHLFYFSKKIDQSAPNFDDYYNNYLIQLEKLSAHVATFCPRTNQSNPQMFWMTPLPQIINMSTEQQEKFNKILHDTELITTKEGFIKFDRYDVWSRRQDLVVMQTGHFSLHGEYK